MRAAGLFVVLVAILVGLYLLTGTKPEAPEGKVIINAWHPWGGSDNEAFRRLIDRFNESQERIFVRLLFVPNNLSSNQKLFLSISAGLPPECTFVDGPQVCEWAARGAIEPIDELMSKHGVRNEDFWEPCYRQNTFLGKTYALTYSADPNFAFLWNKSAFEKSGGAENRPPFTIEELDDFNRRFIRYDTEGRIQQVGFIPWQVFGYTNSIFTWGWAFGGEFYDPTTDRIICGENPGVLRGLNWMMSYADEYGFERLSAFAEGFGDKQDNPFIRGLMATSAGHVSNIRLFKDYAPDLDYRACRMPYPKDMGSDCSAWMGGWCVALPRGGKHPEEAFEFMKWLCTSEEAGRTLISTTGTFPGFKESPAFELIKGDDKLEVFYEVLTNTKHQRPVMPAQAFFMGALERAVVDALNGLKSPEEALMQAQRDTQAELDRIMAPFRNKARENSQGE